MIASRMQNPKHNDPIAFESIEQLVGEAPRHHSAKSAIIFRTEFGILCQMLNDACDFAQELFTQSASLSLIPITPATPKRAKAGACRRSVSARGRMTMRQFTAR